MSNFRDRHPNENEDEYKEAHAKETFSILDEYPFFKIILKEMKVLNRKSVSGKYPSLDEQMDMVYEGILKDVREENLKNIIEND